MDATRVRLVALIEWALAALVIVGVLLTTAAVVREWRGMRAVVPVLAGERVDPEVPMAVPPGAVAVPMLLLAQGREIRLGDRAADIVDRLGAIAQVGADILERSPAGDRVLRFYNFAGTRFVLLLEQHSTATELAVKGIYLE